MRLILRVLKYLRPYKPLAAMCILVIVVSSLVGLLTPWPLAMLVDHVLQDHPLPPVVARVLGPLAASKLSLLLTMVAAGLLVVLLENSLHVLGQYVETKLDQHIILDFRSELFQHAQKLSQAYYDEHRAGGLIYAVNFQADAAAGIVMAIPPLAHAALTLVGMFWVAMMIDWKLALLSMTVVPFLYYSVGFYATHIQARLMGVKQLEGESLSIIHEAISMMKVIVAFVREPFEHARFRRQGKRAVEARVKVTIKQTLFSLAVNMITATGTALVLGAGAYFAMKGRLQVGELLVVMAYIAAVYKPLETISYTVGSLQERFVSLKFAYQLLDEKPQVQDAPDAIEMPEVEGHVKYENVRFAYSRRVDTLKDITFEARAGDVIAVVGPTGAGKTTLVSLLPRFYDVHGGRVLIDGVDLRKITLSSLRQQISIVLQEALLFSGTVAYNIGYGRLDATREEIIEAAKSANAHDFIMALPQQYDTEMGERGAQLSGGERQRISIARAFLKDAPILILDEPTSAIDSRTEAVILDALDRLMAGRTTFIIAHRLSTVRRATQILVLDKGRLVESGSHEELLARNGLYRQLHELQTGVRRAARPAVEEVPA